MRRLTIAVLVLSAFVLAFGCQPKVQAPPPECKINDDCGPNKECSAGKCVKMKTTPQQRAEGFIRYAERLLKEDKIDYLKVIENYQSALKEVANIPGVEYNIALCHLWAGDTAKAEAEFNRLFQAAPGDRNLVLAIGYLMDMAGRTNDELKLYQDFLKNNPEDLEIRANLATLYRLNKKYDDALAEVRRILIKDPAHPGAFNNLSLIYLAQEKVLLARMVAVNGVQAQENVKKKPDASLYNNLGLIWQKLGEMDKAIAHYQKAYETDPKLLSANLNLAHVALRYNDFENAKLHYQAVLSVRPNHREARHGMAQALAGLNQNNEALVLYQELLRETPDDPALHYNIGVLYFDRLKLQEEAHAAFRKFLTYSYPDSKKVEQAKLYLAMEVEKPQAPEPEPQPQPEAAPAPQETPAAEAAPAAEPAAAEPAKEEPKPVETPVPAAEPAPEPAKEEAKPAEAAPAPAPAPEPVKEEAKPAEPAKEEKPADGSDYR